MCGLFWFFRPVLLEEISFSFWVAASITRPNSLPHWSWHYYMMYLILLTQSWPYSEMPIICPEWVAGIEKNNVLLRVSERVCSAWRGHGKSAERFSGAIAMCRRGEGDNGFWMAGRSVVYRGLGKIWRLWELGFSLLEKGSTNT